MSLTDEQAAAAFAAGSVAVTAGAGTGKTHMLTERFLHHLQAHGLRPLQIVAATFTERAADELRGRIREKLAGKPQLAHLAAELEASQIGTLHSLAARICREHPDEAGVPYDFSVQDELNQRLWLWRHLPAALAGLPAHLTDSVPYGTLVDALRQLLADPNTAREALRAAESADLPALIRAERERTFRRMSGSEPWRAAVATLRAHRGPTGDRMEEQRAAAVAAVEAFEAGDFHAGACAALDSLHAGRGSARAWGEEALTELRSACRTLREVFRSGKEAFELEAGPADDELARVTPILREAFELVSAHLEEVKRQERILDFSDLEVHALRALAHPAVRSFYRRRWRAFLIDEFQDTNPVQARLLELLTGPVAGGNGDHAAGATAAPVRLTIVGDEKQSIYGFRRADYTVFRAVSATIGAAGGEVIRLGTSFRTHARLMGALNDIVRPALAHMHQSLRGHRQEPPGEAPFVTVQLLEDGPSLKGFRQRAEAHLVGERIAALLQSGSPVHDKASGSLRPVRPGDIAILARSWDTLGPYGEELAARGIPVIHAGGGSLLEQREAKDGAALLDFLADETDDLALATLLRSPFFAVDDRSLLELARLAGGGSWWKALRRNRGKLTPELERAREVLGELREAAPSETAAGLLERADALTGYSAVLANMPGGPRRHADWRGFRDFVKLAGGDDGDLFTTVRELRTVRTLEGVKVTRPGMEAGNAVSLMSVHNAKGLEWPVVVLPDMTSRSHGQGPAMAFEAELGVASKLVDSEGEDLVPVLYRILERRRKDREADEENRVLYVALTRARDRVLISASSEKGGRLENLRAGLEQAGIELQLEPYREEMALPKTPLTPEGAQRRRKLLGDAGPGFTELPVSALSSYSYCPRRFRYEHVQQHPGAGEGLRLAGRVGTLTHRALERDIDDLAALRRFDATLPAAEVQRALDMARLFRTAEEFAPLRGLISERERPVSHELGGLQLNGVADAVGDDFVLDYKTGSPGEGEEHLLQVAVYAQALGVPRGHVAYLGEGGAEGGTWERTAGAEGRAPEQTAGAGPSGNGSNGQRGDGGAPSARLLSFGEAQFGEALEAAAEIIGRVQAGDFTATPSRARCGRCPFSSICPDSVVRRPRR